tara:strand:+ start:25881 stop:25982 length:102 start_codon:yes stop_codon:yes gene_type:complete
VNKNKAKKSLVASGVLLGLCLAGIIVIGEVYSK